MSSPFAGFFDETYDQTRELINTEDAMPSHACLEAQPVQLRRHVSRSGAKSKAATLYPAVLFAISVFGIFVLAIVAATLFGSFLGALVEGDDALEPPAFESAVEAVPVLSDEDLVVQLVEADDDFVNKPHSFDRNSGANVSGKETVDSQVSPESASETETPAPPAKDAAKAPAPRRTRRAHKPGKSVRQDIVTVPVTRQSSSISSKSGSVYHRSAYFGEVSVGVPAQKFTAVFDTGSGQLVLPSGYCRSETCRAHARYRRSGSKSAFDIDHDGTIVGPGDSRDQITVAFGTGEVTGVFVEDVVCLGNNSNPNTVQQVLSHQSVQQVNQPGADKLPKECMPLRFIAATEMSEHPFKSFVFDGVIGLGLEGLSQTPEFNIVEMMSRSIAGHGGSSPSTFGVFLADLPDEPSEITFGGYNEQRLEEEITWNPVFDPELGHWLVNIKSVRIDDTVLDFCKSGCKGVVDTGTSLLAVPSVVFPEIFELLKHQAPRSGHCKGKGPQLHFELDSYTITLGPKSYARVEEMPAKKNLPPRWHRSQNGTVPRRADLRCKPMLMTMDLPEPLGPKLFILGEPVLRKYYTVYNAKAKSVGFGLAHHRPRASQQIQSEQLILDDVDTEEQRELLPGGMMDVFRIKKSLR